MTWGISDWTDEKTGESNGAFKMTLNFPGPDYETPETTEFLNKMKEFENQILDDAVQNSEMWFGEQMSRDVAKHTFFPFIKYSKNKMTKKPDLTKGPSISPKVPCYNDKWAVEIYDTNRSLLFPSENTMLTPMDFVPKKSKVACVLQCTSIWFGGKGWGVTWKLNQCVVKPSEVISVFGQCRIPDHICNSIDKQEAKTSEDAEEDPEIDAVVPVAATSTLVEDSDQEEEEVQEPAPVKKVVKKAPPAAEPQTQASEEVSTAVAADPAEPPKKKVVKKKV